RWTLQAGVPVDVPGDDDALFGQMPARGGPAVRKPPRSGVVVRAHRDLGRFAEMYGESMRRIEADPFYHFGPAFFEALQPLGEAAVVLDADSAAGLFLCGGGAMHYFLAASTPEARELASASLVLFEAMRFARDHGLTTLALGGGLRDGDALQRFKQSLGEGRAPLWFGAAVHDPEAYERLSASAGVAPDDPFFPAYRRPPR
ncbi:MAG: GNAT family N-acetyltransferase, partial [Gaiellales bacterium]